MSAQVTVSSDEEVLHSDDMPDTALEVAGSKCWEGHASAYTIAFCTGLDTCPSSPVL
jgi:hypothetical protein